MAKVMAKVMGMGMGMVMAKVTLFQNCFEKICVCPSFYLW